MNYICTSQRCRTTCPFVFGLKKGGKLGDRFKVPEKGEMGVYWCMKKEQHGNRSVTRYLLAYRSCTGKVVILETNEATVEKATTLVSTHGPFVRLKAASSEDTGTPRWRVIRVNRVNRVLRVMMLRVLG